MAAFTEYRLGHYLTSTNCTPTSSGRVRFLMRIEYIGVCSEQLHLEIGAETMRGGVMDQPRFQIASRSPEECR
jgi:hypothetical protein